MVQSRGKKSVVLLPVHSLSAFTGQDKSTTKFKMMVCGETAKDTNMQPRFSSQQFNQDAGEHLWCLLYGGRDTLQ